MDLLHHEVFDLSNGKKRFESINATTYKLPIGNEEVEIGNRDAVEFKPHAKIKRWGDECWIKIELSTTKNIQSVEEDDKIKWKDIDKEVHLYPLEPREFEEDGHQVKQLEQGGFEFEIVLKERPTSNKIVIDIETQGLKFYYQKELTQEEKDNGAFRPENVVGAYAIYNKAQDKLMKTAVEGEKYRTGIFGMIYRPQLEDAEGWKIWGEQKIVIDENGKGTQTITIPQEFLDNAVYPIRHATGATFGYETIGATTQDIDDRISGSVFACPDAGTVDSVHLYVITRNSNDRWKCAVYLHSDLSLVGVTVERTGATDPQPAEWNTFNAVGSPALTATDYVLVAWSERTSPTVPGIKYNDGDGTIQGHYESDNYDGNFPATMTATHEDKKYSIHCDYSPTAAPVVKDQLWGKFFGRN